MIHARVNSPTTNLFFIEKRIIALSMIDEFMQTIEIHRERKKPDLMQKDEAHYEIAQLMIK